MTTATATTAASATYRNEPLTRGELGTCPCCLRKIKVTSDGRIGRHGWKSTGVRRGEYGNGFQWGSCNGWRSQPIETTDEDALRFQAAWAEQATQTAARRDELTTERPNLQVTTSKTATFDDDFMHTEAFEDRREAAEAWAEDAATAVVSKFRSLGLKAVTVESSFGARTGKWAGYGYELAWCASYEVADGWDKGRQDVDLTPKGYSAGDDRPCYPRTLRTVASYDRVLAAEVKRASTYINTCDAQVMAIGNAIQALRPAATKTTRMPSLGQAPDGLGEFIDFYDPRDA